MRLLITWPYQSEGRIVEIEREEINSVSHVASQRLGETPKPRTAVV